MSIFGQGVCIRPLPQRSVRSEKAKEILDAVTKLSETESDGTAVHVQLVFELFPRGKISSIASPTDTAYARRSSDGLSVLILNTWDSNAPEKEKAGQEKADSLAKLLMSYESGGPASTPSNGKRGTFVVIISISAHDSCYRH